MTATLLPLAIAVVIFAAIVALAWMVGRWLGR